MKRIIILFIFSLCLLPVSAQQHAQRVPAYRGVIERVQPNGDTLHIYLRGDEHSHYRMTVDGWQVIEDEKGAIWYAIHKKGEIVPSKRLARDADRRRWCERQWLKRKGIRKIEN